MDNGVEVLVKNLGLAKIRILLGLTFGKVYCADTASWGFDFKFDAVAIEIMAGRNFEIGIQCLRIFGCYRKLESLIWRQNIVLVCFCQKRVPSTIGLIS